MKTSVRAIALATLLSGLAAGGIATASHPDQALVTQVHAAVAVDASGRVGEIDFGELSLPEALRAPLLREMRGWEFEPARKAGLPVPSLTHIALSLRAEQVDAAADAWAVRITHASNGPRVLSRGMPRLPLEILRGGSLQMQLLIEADVDAQGVVRSVQVESTRSNLKGRTGARRTARVEEAWEDAFSRWTFLPEQVQGQPIASHITMPMSICVERLKAGAKRDSPTCFEDDADAGDDRRPNIPDGVALAEEPVARLKTNVIGRVL